MIVELIKNLISKWRWERYLRKYTVDNKLVYSREAIITSIILLQNNSLRSLNRLESRKYYISLRCSSLYNLVTYLKEAVYLIDIEGRLPNVNWGVEESIRLDIWLGISDDKDFKWMDILTAVRLCGKLYINILEKGDDVPEEYLSRRLNIAMESYLTMVEIVGDINYGGSE